MLLDSLDSLNNTLNVIEKRSISQNRYLLNFWYIYVREWILRKLLSLFTSKKIDLTVETIGDMLLNSAYKTFSNILLKRSSLYAQENIGEYQCGRSNRSTLDQNIHNTSTPGEAFETWIYQRMLRHGQIQSNKCGSRENNTEGGWNGT